MGLSLTRVSYTSKKTRDLGSGLEEEVLEKLTRVNDGVTVYTLDKEYFKNALARLTPEEREGAKDLIVWIQKSLKRSDIVDIIVG